MQERLLYTSGLADAGCPAPGIREQVPIIGVKLSSDLRQEFVGDVNRKGSSHVRASTTLAVSLPGTFRSIAEREARSTNVTI
jgi:hypothetical protein